jgi:probable F420-dependent oxidoreductase
MIAAAETAERLGWHSIWTTDHVLPDTSARALPYHDIYEALATLAWLGGRVEKIRMGVSVLVVPMRNAVVLAKELASLDALTGGRLIAGVGIGWSKTEFGNLGVGDRFGHRGVYLEETIAMWRHLWSGSGEPFKGRFHEFDDFHFAPLPAQGADLPIWIGATATAALERTGRVADGYHATRADPSAMRDRTPVIAAAAEAAGRPMPVLSARVAASFGAVRKPTWMLSGSSEDMRGQLRAYRDAGVAHLAIDFAELDPDALAAVMERFDTEVLGDL